MVPRPRRRAVGFLTPSCRANRELGGSEVASGGHARTKPVVVRGLHQNKTGRLLAIVSQVVV